MGTSARSHTAAMFDRLKQLLPAHQSEADFQAKLGELRGRAPIPVFWLLGKTQSGKTALIKYLTGADQAEIGQGFRPCTRFTRQYQFPTAEAPLLTFLDTRGLDEPGYDPALDLAELDAQAHIVVVTAKAMDHAQESVLRALRPVRKARPGRPVVLALTCLHEAYPQQPHVEPYPFDDGLDAAAAPEDLRRSLLEQRRRFEGLVDDAVAIDLTRPEDGFADLNYGGERLRQALLLALPEAYRQALLTLDAQTRELQDLFARRALPHIIGYSTLAATAGAFPIPWADLAVLPGIKTRMVYHLAQLYGQPLGGQRFLELASTLGLGIMVRQALRELVKFIPYVGSVAGATLAGASTFALGKAFCYYYAAVLRGHVPRADEIKKYYHDELAQAERTWRRR
jgi:uncharacterized protein (DUF697 family)